MRQDRLDEALAVMAEAQSEDPPSGEPRVPCEVLVTCQGANSWKLALVSGGSRVVDALADNGFFLRLERGAALVEWREPPWDR